MRKLLLLLALLACIPVSGFGQGQTTPIRFGPTIPTVCTPASSTNGLFFKTTSVVGIVYCDTTNHFAYLLDNTNAQTVGGVKTFSVAPVIPFTQTGGTAALTIDAWLKRQPLSVKDYGAVCDGVTDDATALQNAFTAMVSGSMLTFPNAICVSSTDLDLPNINNITLLGTHQGLSGGFSGYAGSVIRFTGATDGLVYGDGTSLHSNTAIIGLGLTTTNAAGGKCINADAPTNHIVNNFISNVVCIPEGAGKAWAFGFHGRGFESSTIQAFHVQDGGGSTGVGFWCDDFCGGTTVNGIQIAGVGNRAIELPTSNTDMITFYGGTIQGAWAQSLIKVASNSSFDGLYLENTDTTPSDGADVVVGHASGVTAAVSFNNMQTFGSYIFGLSGGGAVYNASLTNSKASTITINSPALYTTLSNVRYYTAFTDSGYGTAMTNITGNSLTDFPFYLGCVPALGCGPGKILTIAPLTGVSTWGFDVLVPAEVYDATGWNGDNSVPTKNDVRDKIETLGGSGANTALSNLAAVAINLPLLPDAAAADDFGSATLPFKDLFFAGTSGTPGTNNFKITGASTSGTRVITAANGASVTVIADAGSSNNFLTGISTAGVITKAQPSFSNISSTASDAQIDGTLESDEVAPTEAYSESGWNADTAPPQKDAVRDQFETGEPAATRTFTGKSMDAEATGNILTIPAKVSYRAAICQNTTASLGFSTPTTNAPATICVTGTNTQYAVAAFDAATDESVQDQFMLPADWAGAIDARIRWRGATASTNSVIWDIQTICVADTETGDPAFNTASSVTDAGKGTANQFNDAAITGITATGCAAGEQLFWKLNRDANNGSDNYADDAQLISLEFTIRRAM